MTQMQEGEQQEDRDLSYWLYRIVKWSTIAMGIAIPLAIVGVALGAANYMSGPIQYPAWLLATWMVVDILLVVFLLLHVVLYAVMILEHERSSEAEQVAFVGGIITGLVLLIGGGLMIQAKHLAWVSLFELLLLAAATVINVIYLVQMRES